MKVSKLLPGLLAGILLAGCGSDDKESPERLNLPGPSGQGAANSHFDDESPIYLVKSTQWVGDVGTSYHFLTNTLDTETVFDKDTALAWDEYTGISVPEGDNPDRAFFVGRYDSPKIERWVVGETGDVSLNKTIDLSLTTRNSGRNLLRSAKIMSATKGYILDFYTLQVIVFNPTEMVITKKIPLELDEPADATSRWSIFPTTDGDRFVATIGYYSGVKGSTDHALTNLVIVDTNDDSYVTDTYVGCTGVSGAGKDANGNLYFASYATTALDFHQGTDDAYTPCVIRLMSGANKWDDSYFLNMQNLTNDARLAAGTVSGNGNFGYTLVLNKEGESTITNETGFRQAVALPNWEFHWYDLTDSNAIATKVEGVSGSIARILNGTLKHHELGDIAWMAQTDPNYEANGIYNSTNPENWTVISKNIPGELEYVGRLR